MSRYKKKCKNMFDDNQLCKLEFDHDMLFANRLCIKFHVVLSKTYLKVILNDTKYKY